MKNYKKKTEILEIHEEKPLNNVSALRRPRKYSFLTYPPSKSLLANESCGMILRITLWNRPKRENNFFHSLGCLANSKKSRYSTHFFCFVNRPVKNIPFVRCKQTYRHVVHAISYIFARKPSRYGIRGIPLSLSKFQVNNHTQCTDIDSHQSSFQSIKCGVPQWSVLGFCYAIFM